MGCICSKSPVDDQCKSVEFGIRGGVEKSLRDIAPPKLTGNNQQDQYTEQKRHIRTSSHKSKRRDECDVVTYESKNKIQTEYSDYYSPINPDYMFDKDFFPELKTGTIVLFTEEELQTLFDEFFYKTNEIKEPSITRVEILTTTADSEENQGILFNIKEDIIISVAKQIMNFIFNHFKQ